MDPRTEFFKAAFFKQKNSFDFPLFMGTSRYQYGQGLGDFLRGIVRLISRVAQFFKPVAIKKVQTLLNAVSESIKEGATVKDVSRSTLKPTVCAVCGATIDQVACL